MITFRENGFCFEICFEMETKSNFETKCQISKQNHPLRNESPNNIPFQMEKPIGANNHGRSEDNAPPTA